MQDKQILTPILQAQKPVASHYGFTAMFLWQEIYDIQYAIQNEFLFIRSKNNEKYSFYFPVGGSDIKGAIDQLDRYCRDQNIPLTLFGLDPVQYEQLESVYPGRFFHKSVRNAYDYLYDASKLAGLEGKKLHAKRNFINRFQRENEDWEFEPITRENIDEVIEMNRQWCQQNDCSQSESLRSEACAVKRCLKNFWDLDVTGGLLRAGGEVVAYSVASLLSPEAADIHIEKAFAACSGAYPMINREMVRLLIERYPTLRFINREDDVGDEGLRKAKLSYYPEQMVEKILATEDPAEMTEEEVRHVQKQQAG